MYINEKYEVLEILHKGDDDTIYKVKDTCLNRVLIIKEIIWRDNQECIEGVIMKCCFHPAIPVIIESFRVEDRSYLVMEFVKGVTLAEYLEEKGALRKQPILEIGRQLFEVLNYLHHHQPAIVYGDIKPENIMITLEGNLKLIDFGSAFFVKEGVKKISGTLGYAAPELIQKGEADERSDIYSLGCLLHYMISGENPCKPPYLRRPLEECGKAIDISVQKLIHKATAAKPKDRFQDMKSFQEAFRCMERPYWRPNIIKAGLRVSELICWSLASIYLFCDSRTFSLTDFLAGTWRWKEVGILTLIGMMCHLLIIKKENKKRRFYMQKNIWKTEKRGIGLFLLLVILAMTGITVNAQANRRENSLPIQLYSEKGYKVCVKEGESLSLKGALRMEIPKEYLQGEGLREVLIIVKNPITGEEERGIARIKLGE